MTWKLIKHPDGPVIGWKDCSARQGSDTSGYVSWRRLVEAMDEAIRDMSMAVATAPAEEVELYVFAIRFLKKLRELLREKEC